MASIRHIAIFSDHPKKLAEFYRDVFGMTITGIDDKGNAWVTDGYMDVALIGRYHDAAPTGIHHWGFTLDDDEKPEIYARMKELGLEPFDPRSISKDPNADRPFVEDAARDIDGNRFDLTTSGMRSLRNAPPDAAEKKEPVA